MTEIEVREAEGSAIQVRGAVRRFHAGVEVVTAVAGVDLTVSPGELVCIYGASGSGKSTLLNLVGGLDVPDEGEIVVAGVTVSSLSADQRADLRLTQVGVVFQSDNLLWELDAAENVMLPLLARGVSRAIAEDEAAQVMGTLGVAELLTRRPAAMSGGQRQRVGIARALVGGRSVLLADEPTGALDSANSAALFTSLATLCRREGVAAIVATHDPLARDAADRVLHMVDGVLSAAVSSR